MIKRDLIMNKLDMIHTSVTRLAQLAALEESDFVGDPDNFAIAEHHLRRSLEGLFDIGRHIMAKKGLGHPKDYRSIITILGQQGIIPADFAGRIAGMAGYRNRLVHGYAEVSAAEMYQLLRTRLEDFNTFSRHILEYLRR